MTFVFIAQCQNIFSAEHTVTALKMHVEEENCLMKSSYAFIVVFCVTFMDLYFMMSFVEMAQNTWMSSGKISASCRSFMRRHLSAGVFEAHSNILTEG